MLRYTRLSNGEPLVAGRTVTGFANLEEDYADRYVWDLGALWPDTHVMPWRIEDELEALGANFIQPARSGSTATYPYVQPTRTLDIAWSGRVCRCSASNRDVHVRRHQRVCARLAGPSNGPCVALPT